MIVEAEVNPATIDDLRIGRHATVRFPAFNTRTTPELAGTVARIPPDRMIDEATGQPYYTVEVFVAQHEIERLEDRKLLPGMPAEIFVRTEPRTPLSYFLRPLTDHLRHAWREQ